MPTVVIIGASRDRTKFGNKSVRAHLRAGYRVIPIHPSEKEIEGLPVVHSIAEVREPLDRVTLYVPPEVGAGLLEAIASARPKELFLNPGTMDREFLERALELGLTVRQGCSIVDLGYRPSDFPA